MGGSWSGRRWAAGPDGQQVLGEVRFTRQCPRDAAWMDRMEKERGGSEGRGDRRCWSEGAPTRAAPFWLTRDLWPGLSPDPPGASGGRGPVL